MVLAKKSFDLQSHNIHVDEENKFTGYFTPKHNHRLESPNKKYNEMV